MTSFDNWGTLLDPLAHCCQDECCAPTLRLRRTLLATIVEPDRSLKVLQKSTILFAFPRRKPLRKGIKMQRRFSFLGLTATRRGISEFCAYFKTLWNLVRPKDRGQRITTSVDRGRSCLRRTIQTCKVNGNFTILTFQISMLRDCW